MPTTDTLLDDRVRAGLYLSGPKPSARNLKKQREWCRIMASLHGVEVVREYIDVPADPNILRTGVRDAISDLRAGNIGALNCTDPSRLSRDPRLLLWILQQIAAARGWLLFAGPLTLGKVGLPDVRPADAESAPDSLAAGE